MSCYTYKNNELYIENVSVQKIARSFSTPTYVYSHNSICKNIHLFQDAFSDMNYLMCYAVKANSNVHILKIFADKGLGFDIVSIGELHRVLKAGGDVNKIIFSGVGKTEEEIEAAIKLKIHCINAESVSELHRVEKIAKKLNYVINVSLRVNLDIDANTHAHISTGKADNKFGIPYDEVLAIISAWETFPHLKLIGIGSHIGSQILDASPLLKNVTNLFLLLQKINDMGFVLEHMNIGGGMGINYHDEIPLDIFDYAEKIRDIISSSTIQMIIEPGRSLIGNAGMLLTEVQYIKTTKTKSFAILNAGMNDLLRPAFYDAWHNILPVYLHTGEEKNYDMVGPVCESSDYLAKDRKLILQEGDYLAIDCAGAYGFSMSSNYNSRCRAAEVLVTDDQIKLIRKRETLDDLMANEE